MKLITKIIIFLIFTGSMCNGASTGDWRSTTTGGNWNTTAAWERYSSTGTWEAFGIGENIAPGFGYPNTAALGNVSILSGHTITWNAASVSCGPVTVDFGGILSHVASAGIYASLTVNGSLTIGTASNSNKGMTITGDLTVGGTGTITLVAGAANGNKHTLTIGGNLINNGSISATAVSTTFTTKTLFVFSKAGAATISSTGSAILTAFGNLNVNSGTTLDIQTPVTIGGALTSVVVVNGSITSSGNGSILYSSILGPNFLTYSGTTGQQTTGPEFNSTSASVPSLIINNSNGIKLGGDAIVRTTLSMNAGNLELNGKTITLGTSTTGTLKYTSGFITGTGTFKRWFSAGLISSDTAGTFPIGTGLNKRSIVVGGSPTKGGTISVSYIDTNTVSHPFGPSFTENSQTFVNRYDANWNITVGDSLTGSNFTIAINGNGIPGINAISDINVSAATGPAPGNYAVPTGTLIAPVVNRAGLTELTLPSTYYYSSTINSDLPVELISFISTISGRQVKLSWETRTEVNTRQFDIDRAKFSGDGSPIIWSNVGVMKAAGTTVSPIKYSYTEKNLQVGKYQYRLKMIDNNGSYRYSNIVETEIGLPSNFEISQNYPNPFNPSTKIDYQVPFDSRVILEVYYLTGQKVVELVNQDQQAGYYSVNFGSSSGRLASGIYFYRIIAKEKANGNNFLSIKKMVLMK
jgi:hypothetical protein